LISLPRFFNENTEQNLRLLKMIDKTLYRTLMLLNLRSPRALFYG